MTTLKASSGRLLVRPTGRVLATSCGGSAHCSPCITTEQDTAAVSLSGSCGDFNTCGLVDMMPSTIRYCESWEQQTWAGDCCWVFAEYVDISQWTAPDWIFNYVLIISYNRVAGTYSAAIYCGSDFDDGDRCNWMVGAEPLFVSTSLDLACGQDGKLTGTIDMEGRDSGWGGADATGYTCQVTL